MEFRVYEVGSNRDVTDEAIWLIDTDGDLRFIADNDPSGRYLAMADSRCYYYKVEFKIMND